MAISELLVNILTTAFDCLTRLPYTEGYFCHLMTLSVDFCIGYAECPPHFYFRSSWPTYLESVLHVFLLTVENFDLFWSWYDYLLPSYSVLATDTLRDLMTLTFDFLILVSGHTWQVACSTCPPSLKILRLLVLELWVLTALVEYHWQCICSHCACAVSRNLRV